MRTVKRWSGGIRVRTRKIGAICLVGSYVANRQAPISSSSCRGFGTWLSRGRGSFLGVGESAHPSNRSARSNHWPQGNDPSFGGVDDERGTACPRGIVLLQANDDEGTSFGEKLSARREKRGAKGRLDLPGDERWVRSDFRPAGQEQRRLGQACPFFVDPRRCRRGWCSGRPDGGVGVAENRCGRRISRRMSNPGRRGRPKADGNGRRGRQRPARKGRQAGKLS